MLLYPDYRKNRITDISADFLSRNGIRGIILDVDNTLTRHHTGQLENGVPEWIDTMKKANISLVIASNSQDFRIRPFAKSVGLDYISLCLKPIPFKMMKAAKKMGLKKKECLMVGDQIFTDVLGARLAGIKILLTEPFCEENKGSFIIRRKLEHKIKQKHEGKDW